VSGDRRGGATKRAIILASRSPRRQRLLESAGISVAVVPAPIDDAAIPLGPVPPAWWVVALAWLKARSTDLALAETERRLGAAPAGLILAADTVCVCAGTILGQPRTPEEARAMLDRLAACVHETITGACILDRATGERTFVFDRATVTVGAIPRVEIDRYVASGAWRGKAGAYNLEERVAAGWPISCAGDPATVMGLPMRRLAPILAPLRAAAADAPQSDAPPPQASFEAHP
jgi:septum formation protein